MKRIVTLLLAAALAVGGLAGCSGTQETQSQSAVGTESTAASTAQESTAPTSDRKKITALMRSSESQETYRIWGTLLDEYAEQNGLETEFELVPADADYVNKLQLYISSDQLPDFYGCANGTFSSAAKNIGGIVNIGEELKKVGKYDDMNKAVIDFFTDAEDGEMYLFPNALYAEFFMYRKDKFDEYGLTAPATWDEFVQVCAALKEKGETPVVVGGAENWQIMRYLSFMPLRVTHDGFIMSFIDQTDSFAQNETAQKGVNLVQTMGENGYFQDGFISTDWTSAVSLFFGGTGCMFYSGGGQIDQASEMYSNGQLGIFPVPDVDGATNIQTNVPVHGGFGNAFNAKTYDETMQGFFAYACDRYHEITYQNGVFSPFNYDMPEGLPPMFYEVKPLIEQANQSWVSWDDKLDSATLTSMASAQKELALGMMSPGDFMADMDQIVKENNPK